MRETALLICIWMLGTSVWPAVAAQESVAPTEANVSDSSVSEANPAGLLTGPSSSVRTSTAKRLINRYADLSSCFVLHPYELPGMPASILGSPNDNEQETVKQIEQAFADDEMEFVQQGQRFVVLLPTDWRESDLAPHLARLTPPPVAPDEERKSRAVFKEASLGQFLEFYAQLRNRTLIRPSRLADHNIEMRIDDPVSHEEMVYACNVVLALNGIAAFDDGPQFVQLLPIHDSALAQLTAPKRTEQPELLTPNEVISTPHPFDRGQGRQSFSKSEIARLYSKYVGSPPRFLSRMEGEVEELLKFYAELSGQSAVRNPTFDQIRVPFSVQTALTKEEILYAIKTTLELNGMTIVPVRGGIQLDRHFRPVRQEQPAAGQEKPADTGSVGREAN